MIFFWIAGAVMLAAMSMIVIAISQNQPRDIDQEYEDQMKYLHEYYQKKQRRNITVR